MENNYYKRVWLRLIAVFSLMITVPVAIMVLVTTNSLRDAAIEKIEVSLGRLIDHKKDVITLYLKEKEDLLAMMVGMYPITYLGRQENLDALFMAVNKNGSIVDLHVIDSSGKQLAYVGPYAQSLVGKSYHDAQWFQDVLIKGSHVSDVFLGFRNIPHFVVAVSDPLKTYVLRATINSEQFNKLLLSSQIGPHGDSFIVNRDGTLQTPSRAGLTELGAEDRLLLEHHEGTAIIQRQESVFARGDDKIVNELGGTTVSGGTIISTREESVVATRWVKDGQWCLFVKALIKDSLGPFHQVRNNIIIVVIAISAVFLAVAVLLTNYFLNRIAREDLKRAELGHQMVQMEKMATVGRLAAGIAHEINNPLQMITSQAGWIGELLPEEEPEKIKNLDEYIKAVEQIKQHVRRAGTITHRLLGFSRKISAEKENVRINDLIEETISFVEKEAGYNNVSIVRTYAEDLPAITTDGPQLQQVFLNLINNAIDEIGQGGIIEIRTAVQGNNVIVEFADNGHGIKAENLKRIFDPFFTTKDPGKGTGLGLYISYDIVKKLGGTISVANRNSGGAVFSIGLPLTKVSSGR
jgi:two-component system, NtrC family, sensor kinase